MNKEKLFIFVSILIVSFFMSLTNLSFINLEKPPGPLNEIITGNMAADAKLSSHLTFDDYLVDGKDAIIPFNFNLGDSYRLYIHSDVYYKDLGGRYHKYSISDENVILKSTENYHFKSQIKIPKNLIPQDDKIKLYFYACKVVDDHGSWQCNNRKWLTIEYTFGPQCTDEDGLDIFTAGITKVETVSNRIIFDEDYYDHCQGPYTVVEYACNPERANLVRRYEQKCAHGCMDGACLKEISPLGEPTIGIGSVNSIELQEPGITFKVWRKTSDYWGPPYCNQVEKYDGPRLCTVPYGQNLDGKSCDDFSLGTVIKTGYGRSYNFKCVEE